MKKVFKFLLAVSLPFLLVSCNSGSNENNSDNDSTQNPDADTNTDDTTNNGENSGNGDNVDKTIPTYTGMSISDTVEKTAVPQGQIKKAASTNYDFYVQAKSTFYIEIHLDNPSQYEILSFTLNDVKYQSYEFNKGSNSELLILEAKAPDTAGNKIFNLSSIKYVDGESIKDVDLSSAKRSIDVGITYAELPSVNVLNENVSYTSYNALFDVDAKDIPDFKYECIIYDENNKEVSSFSSGSTTYNLSVKANKLKMNSTYTYEFIGTFDYCDGKGTTEHSFGEGTFTTLDGVKIINESVTSTSFSFEYDIKEPSVKISNIYYRDTVDNSVTKCDVSSTNISGLKSNRDYNLYVSYTYGEFSGHLETNFKTLAKQPGSYTVSNVTPTANSVSFSLNIDDEDGATNISSITLYDEETGQKVKTLTNTNDLRFTDLYSNHNYRIEVLYYNNLNDGSSNQYSTLTESFTTLANIAPSYSFVLGNTSFTTAEISFNENDPSDIGNVESFELYRNDSPVPELTTKTFEEMSEKLKNLYSASKYTLKANYSYDLNEGEGEVDKSIFIEFYTSKYDAPTFNINVGNKGFDNVSFNINQSGYEDLISKTLKVVNKETEEVLYTTNEFALNNSISVNGLNSNSTYEIIIEYSYDLDDGNGVINQTVSSEFTTSKYDEPLVDVSLSNSGYDYMDIYISGNSLDRVTYKKLEVINKDNQIVIYTNDNFNFYDYLTISNLYSNSTYEVILTYKYDLHDGKGEIENKVSQEYSTTAYSTPSIYTYINSTDYTSMNFYAYIGDGRDFISSVKFEVINVSNNDVVFSQDTFNEYDNIYVNGLNSNTSYVLRTTYKYDLNDGKGVVETSNDLEFKTKMYDAPSVDLYNMSIGFKSLNFDVHFENAPTVLSAYLELIDNDTQDVIAKYEDIENGQHFFIDSLTSNHDYKVKVIYEYNLNDGSGILEGVYENDYSTKELLDYDINVEISYISDTYFNYYINLTNKQNVIRVDYSELIDYETKESVQTINFNYGWDGNNSYSFDNLLSNHKYKLIVYYSLFTDEGINEQHSIEKIITTNRNYEPQIYLSSNYSGDNFVTLWLSGGTGYPVKFNSVSLYDEKGTLVDTKYNLNNRSYVTFRDLLQNENYYVQAEYQYDLLDGKGFSNPQLTEKEIFYRNSGHSYQANVESVGKDFATIKLHNTNESDSVITLTKAYMYKKDDPGNIIKEFTFNTEEDQLLEFTGLQSYTEYVVDCYYNYRYKYSGDVGDLDNLKQTFTFITMQEERPELSFNYEVTDHSISYSINIIEGNAKNGYLETVELLDENYNPIVTSSGGVQSGEYRNLSSKTKYHLRANYRYTLNDGKGEYLYSVMENGYATLNGKPVFNEYYYRRLGAIDVIISDNKLYAIFSGRGYSWDDCVKMCEEMGGHLITTNDDNEEAILDELLDSTNNLNSWIGGYYEDDSWHWISGEEFVFDQDNFYYPSTVDPNNGDVLKSWFDVARYWYTSPTIGSNELVAYVLELDIGGASNTWIETL